VEARPITLFHSSTQDRLQQFDEEINWIGQISDLLGYLRGRISQTAQAWEQFEAPNGDVCYFSDFVQLSHIINNIRGSFEELKSVEEKLVHLDEYCGKKKSKIVCFLRHLYSAHTNFSKLELGMSLESNRLNLETHQLSRINHSLSLETSRAALSNQKISQWTLLVR
jgi:hypothetical protein